MVRVLNSLTGMKFLAFVLVVGVACWKVEDDAQFALLVGGAFAALLTANATITRKSIEMGRADADPGP